MKAFILLAACFAVALAFDVPEPFKWDESFEVFYEKLDEQHKGLFDAFFEACNHPSDATALTNLKDVVEKHFRFEEGMMKAAHYSEYDVHHKVHTDFEHDLESVHTPVSSEKCHWAKTWLVNHVKGVDFKYKGKL